MQHRSQRDAPVIRLFSGRWWLCLWTTLLFVFSVNYIPAHLAGTAHLHEAVAAVLDSVLHLHDHADVPSDERPGGHTPHPASDHDLTFTAQGQSLGVVLLIAFIPAEATLPLDAPQVAWSNPIIERIKPPGESPPGPAQPRAPPIA